MLISTRTTMAAIATAVEFCLRGAFNVLRGDVAGPASATAGRLATGAGATGLGAGASEGKIFAALRQSGHPSRQTKESALTRPSAIHLRITSPAAGPYCPPAGGRTYHTAWGASAIGSTSAGDGITGAIGAMGAGP